MPNPNGLLDRVSGLSGDRETRAALASQVSPQVVTVNFQGGRSGHLDVTAPLARHWADTLDRLRQEDRAAYVEIDPLTNAVTEVFIPQASRVQRVGTDPAGNLEVSLIPSQARHTVPATNPDFSQLRTALESALAGGSDVLVVANRSHEIIEVRALPKAPPKAPPKALAPMGLPPGPPPEGPQPVTQARAQELFDQMESTTCDCSVTPPCIPFKYPNDGCYARAHEMCRLMMNEGEQPEKVWIYGYPHGVANLRVDTANEPINCYVNWWYHVAPTLLVDMPGGAEKQVIDPALFEGPVSVSTWRAKQTDPNSTLEYTAANIYAPGGGTDDIYASTNLALADKRSLLHTNCLTYGPPPYDCPIQKRCVLITDRSTFGEDEVTAMLQLSSPAAIKSAFYVVVDGFSPNELGITTFTPPSMEPQFLPNIDGMSVKVTNLAGDYEALPNRRQRLTWTCKVEFTNTNGFVPANETVQLTATVGGVSGSALIHLIEQPNPYEIDGATSWLSTDVRVFQIKDGEARFGATMGGTAALASTFIKEVIANLNHGTSGGQTFDSISTDEDTSHLELSEQVNGTAVFNFAVARVRYQGTIGAQNVRVFFRLLPASTTSTDYQPSTTYASGGQSGVKIPLLGVQGNALVSIPCFAEPRVNSAIMDLNQQTDPANVQPVAATGGIESSTYFGCWLDINQPEQQFPAQPASAHGTFPTGRLSIKELVRSQHQCLVAEIAFDPDPIQTGVFPGESDKLAQRNLSIVPSANPGDGDSRRIPLTFEIRPSRAGFEPGEQPDELMILWGNTPAGSVATLYLPGIDVDDVLARARALYRCHRLGRIDEHTLRCPASGVTFVPIPPGGVANHPGLLTVELPGTVRKGQSFKIVVRQVTNAGGKPPVVIELRALLSSESASAGGSIRWRKVLGTFQLTIPVRTKEEMLEPESRLLSVLRWVEKSVPENDRWHPVFRRYVQQTAARVDGLGGYSADVVPCPSGEDVTLRLRIVNPDGSFFDKAVDIEVRHRTLESEPGKNFRRVVPKNVFLVKHLRRFPQSDYIVTVTPSGRFKPESQFVTIPAAGCASLRFVVQEKT